MFRFHPEYKPVRWGSRHLADEFGRALPDGPVGESWELVELDEHHSAVADGPEAGAKLGDLWRGGRLGGTGVGPFPVLLKWLDTGDLLSVQVHPDEKACLRLGAGRPKSEAWCIVQAEAHATLFLGHYPGLDAATLRQAATGGTIHKWLFELRPRAGELYAVPAGTLHAIGPGILLLEAQQPSDTTLRVYDWGRGDASRPLHLDEACVAVHFERPGPFSPQRGVVAGPSFSMRKLAVGSVLGPTSLRVLVAHVGPVTLGAQRGDTRLELGDVVVAERADGELRVAGSECILVSEA